MRKCLLLALLLSTSTAWADAGVAAEGNPMSQFMVLGVFLFFMYFMIIRPQSKRAKEHRNLITSLSKGDEVVTTGGLVGKITSVEDTIVRLFIADNVEVCIQKNMIASSLPKGTMKSL